MPTFILVENGKEAQSVRGANVPAIRDLVKYAKTELAKEKRERGEDVKIEEIENDGIDESALPSQTVNM